MQTHWPRKSSDKHDPPPRTITGHIPWTWRWCLAKGEPLAKQYVPMLTRTRTSSPQPWSPGLMAVVMFFFLNLEAPFKNKGCFQIMLYYINEYVVPLFIHIKSINIKQTYHTAVGNLKKRHTVNLWSIPLSRDADLHRLWSATPNDPPKVHT